MRSCGSVDQARAVGHKRSVRHQHAGIQTNSSQSLHGYCQDNHFLCAMSRPFQMICYSTFLVLFGNSGHPLHIFHILRFYVQRAPFDQNTVLVQTTETTNSTVKILPSILRPWELLFKNSEVAIQYPKIAGRRSTPRLPNVRHSR